MAGAILVGNMALMADVAASRPHVSDRGKLWPSDPLTIVRTKRDPPPPAQFVLSAVSNSDGPGTSDFSRKKHNWNPLLFGKNKSWWKRRRSSPKLRSSASSEPSDQIKADENPPSDQPKADENSPSDQPKADENEDSDGWEEWEEELKKTVKEMEEMQELEKAADELQTRADADADEGESEEAKRERVRRELEKVAKEQAERRKTADLMFELGKKAYGRGMYSRAIEFLEASLTIIPGATLLGGEIQIWLAMAYEAGKRHKDCIELYKQLEKQHPALTIRRQAAELRYILQAPKLKISKDEMVTIPLIGSSYDWYAGTWTDKVKEQEMKRKVGASEAQSSGNYFGEFFLWSPPSGWEKNRNLWGIVTLWAFLVGTALLLQR